MGKLRLLVKFRFLWWFFDLGSYFFSVFYRLFRVRIRIFNNFLGYFKEEWVCFRFLVGAGGNRVLIF